MIDLIKNLYEAISIIDLIYLILTILSVIKCYRKGFVLSIVSSFQVDFSLCSYLNFIPKN